MNLKYPRFRISVDRGGTFTDVVGDVTFEDGTTHWKTLKLLSCDPQHYPDAPSEGIRRIMRCYIPDVVPARGLIENEYLDEVRMGTTVATNALLEHNGERSVMVLTEGFADILDIRDQARPSIFALHIKKNPVLAECTVEAKERVRIISLKEARSTIPWPKEWIKCGESYIADVVRPLEKDDLRQKLQKAYNDGIRSVGVSLLHSYAYSKHEEEVKEIAKGIGFTNISLSSELMALMKYVPRSTTASVDAYLTPLIFNYIRSFRANFKHNMLGTRLYFMQSDGGLTSADDFFGFRSVLSGPAGGVMGCARCAVQDLGEHVQVVGIDMGGTSTDVSRCDGESVSHIVESEISGIQLHAPQVRVHTVAAGGGSLLKWENGIFCVGPGSAGSHPGPACYGKGGPLTVTDANLVLGHLNTEFFPRVFGLHADEPLHVNAARALFETLTQKIANDTGKPWTVEEVAHAFVVVANETMCRPIRNITEANGYSCPSHTLAVFGGAGGQHACAIARSLGMARIYFHPLASLLSAVGVSMTDIVQERISSSQIYINQKNAEAAIQEQFRSIATSAKEELQRLGFDDDHIVLEHYLSMRYEGTSTSIMVLLDGTFEDQTVESGESDGAGNLMHRVKANFTHCYEQQFGFLLMKREIMVDAVRVRGRGVQIGKEARARIAQQKQNSAVHQPPYSTRVKLAPRPISTMKTYLSNGWETVNVYIVNADNGPVEGPAVLVGKGTSILLESNSIAYTNDSGSLIIHTSQLIEKISTALHPLHLSIFSHRFMSIAEQMGNALQRTSISTNIKERLDFSCAIFDKNGNLVANAPHIPVHLGAMGAAIRWQREYYGDQWREGEMLLSNHPACGGSHLPDITVMSPFFFRGEVIFYVASRGHHADVGGTTPGSMPPFSKTLQEEGAAIKTVKLIEDGIFQEERIRELLLKPGKCTRMSGCRTLEDSISDLHAQVAANKRGMQLLKELMETYGYEVVQAYMGYIQDLAEASARDALKRVAKFYGTTLPSVDYMDDGSEIRLKIEIDPETGSSCFDFTGTSSQVLNSTNCPTAVVYSAIIYCIRCIVDADIPLNQGCMRPIRVVLERGSILSPDDELPVVAGNVLTSQRVTDVIFTALRAVACSHGCMNNFTMGSSDVAYYETICGGSGAGDGFNGASAVHTHMTNTRMTDPEILETRYPVILRFFRIRRGSGGKGKYKGGDGVVRSFLFLQDLTAVLLTERRVLEPKGLFGGGNGMKGLNMVYVPNEDTAARWSVSPQEMLHDVRRGEWTREEETRSSDGCAVYRARNAGGKNVLAVRCGDILTIHTGGGGGCYPEEAKQENKRGTIHDYGV
ncbi:putative 5-oxoprolinase [Trypanosoma cruzi]|uniref:Putative 5-oxoprolinase n=1 Tax=Trypanosoma cruzi TaxID=5693 RepID=A0A2V2XMZ3_TRYCR|nr:putative 5-oxoprolinase [Trypanosoma cruzi]